MNVVYYIVHYKDFINEIRFASELDFKVVELSIRRNFLKSEIAEISDLLKRSNLKTIIHIDEFLTTYYPYRKVNNVLLEEIFDIISLKDLWNFKLVGIHLDPIYRDPKNYLNYISNLSSIINFANSSNIQIVCENGYTSIEFLQQLAIDIPHLKLLFDIGHANLHQEIDYIQKYLNNFCDRIEHVHIHDNRGFSKCQNSDLHLPLGVGTLDWKNVVNSIKAIGYDKSFSLEFDCLDRNIISYNKQLLEKIYSLQNNLFHSGIS